VLDEEVVSAGRGPGTLWKWCSYRYLP